MVVNMLHIVSPRPWVAGYHSSGPAADLVLAKSTIIWCLVGAHHNFIQHANEVIYVGSTTAGAVSPEYFVPTN